MEADAATVPAVGIVVLGHGESATRLLQAAQGIVGGGLNDLIAVDAGEGQTPQLEELLCETIERADAGRGVLLIVDLLGSSPCTCGQREAAGHRFATLGGLNLAMLIKLASLDRRTMNLEDIAKACAESGRRAVELAEGSD
jgi:PTS system mannose-specific IIA component